MENLRIVFMGTPEFAVSSLRKLVNSGYNIVGVITSPDKPSGRGQQMSESAVKRYALKKNLDIIQPANLKDPDFIDKLKSLRANLQVVVAFRMLPEIVWSMPEYGTINLHASLLPQYRGAAPINWAIINGEKETGVTTFFLKHQIDTGNIILREKVPIKDSDTAGTLHNTLMIKGASLVLRTVRAIEGNDLNPAPQKDIDVLKHAPKIYKKMCRIDWSDTNHQIINFIRGLSPYPGAWTVWKNHLTLKIFAVSIPENQKGQFSNIPGEMKSDGKDLHVRTGDNWLRIDELQLEGKRRMRTSEFLKGNKL